MLRIYAKVDTCDWVGMFFTHDRSTFVSQGSDIKEVRVYPYVFNQRCGDLYCTFGTQE
jgi:hypothetical protein